MNKVNHYIENLLAQYSSRNVNAFIDTAAEDMSSVFLSKVELEGGSEEGIQLVTELRVNMKNKLMPNHLQKH